jgi:hypothetical protein
MVTCLPGRIIISNQQLQTAICNKIAQSFIEHDKDLTKTKRQLWWMIISVDYDYSRIIVADHELNEDILTLWLEDKHDFKNSLEECLQVDIAVKQFAKVIRAKT